MGFYTYLVLIEATVEGPDPGEACDDLVWAIKEHATLLTNEIGEVKGMVHDIQPQLRWWPGSIVETVQLQREQAKAKRRKRK